MKVFLQPTDFEVHVTYAEEPRGTAREDHSPSRPGLRGWVVRKVNRFKTLWHDSRGGLSRRLGHVWDWLQRRMFPDEALLARLRSVDAIQVHHPADLTISEARALWSRYLASRQRRHWPWFVTNALVTPLTVVLMFLPGPNVVGYWFAYRSVHHLLILIGLRRALSERVATSFHPIEGSSTPGPGSIGGGDVPARGEIEGQLAGTKPCLTVGPE